MGCKEKQQVGPRTQHSSPIIARGKTKAGKSCPRDLMPTSTIELYLCLLTVFVWLSLLSLSFPVTLFLFFISLTFICSSLPCPSFQLLPSLFCLVFIICFSVPLVSLSQWCLSLLLSLHFSYSQPPMSTHLAMTISPLILPTNKCPGSRDSEF